MGAFCISFLVVFISVAIFIGLYYTLTRSRIGIIIQAAITHPHTVASLGHNVVTGSFPFKASGRAMSLDSTDGFVKAIADADTKQLLGVVAVGRGVSEFIGEATLALEMGAFLEDVALTIHPHPTMSEALQEAIEGALGQAVHMVNK